MKYAAQCMLWVWLTVSGAYAQVTVIPNSDTVERYGLYELSIRHDAPAYANPWEDVSVTARLTNGDGTTVDMNGFYYGNSEWRLRFSPPATGAWQWSLDFTTPTHSYAATGAFYCEPSDRLGFVRRHPTNPFRLVFEDGSLFNAVGIGDCILDVDQDGDPLNNWGFDGEFRGPKDPRYGRIVDMPVYMAAYGAYGAGFNLFRWSIDNCAFKVWDTISTGGNRYLVQEGIWGDELVTALRDYGFRIWLTFFNVPVYPNAADNPAQAEAVRRYLRYVVARYGAYVDIWELMNETNISAAWIAMAADYVRAIDPYGRLITTSWERPELPGIDINAPHWYQREDERQSDALTARKIADAKRHGKPVMFGEQGNSVQNWDPRSALRMRLRSWTAFFEEGVLVFWNSSFAKDYFSGAANLYIGPEERGYIRALQDFTAAVDGDVQRFALTPSENDVRGYGLQSPRMILGYLHHADNHRSSVRTAVTVDLPKEGTVIWLEPGTGDVLRSFPLTSGRHTLITPPFVVDLALRIEF